MLYRIAADAIVVAHLGFVFFVVAGGFLAWKWRWIPWMHAPAAVWGALIEFRGWICPLTPLENQLRQAAGVAGYEVGFIEHYIMPLLYPPGLNTSIQLSLGAFVVVLNVAVYTVYVRRRSKGAGRS